MKLKSILFLSLALLLLNNQTLPIIPPLKGVTPPANFKYFKDVISKDYNSGYFAHKYQERFKNNQLNKTAINSQDTVFALTLLGKFTDLAPHFSDTVMTSHLFTGPNPTGTVTDYYKEISYNKMFFTGSCNGWYQLPASLSSYMGNNNGLSVQGGPRFVYDLIVASDSSVNYANYIQYYDNAGYPHIGFIAVIHTGADAAAGAPNLWSHRWTFEVYSNSHYVTNDIDPISGRNVIIDGDYALEPELKGANNYNGGIVDIGVFAHEFGHIFGLPDLYDTDNSSEGLGQWCLMASGSWGANGSSPETPSHMSAWCKIQMGWLTPVDITSYNKDLHLPKVETDSLILKLYKQNTVNPSEYFLVENRQKYGFDKNILNDGLLIYHIDENQGSNNDENHYLADVEQADGRRDLNNGVNRGDDGDPFPGRTGNINFAINTFPNSNGYDGSHSFVSVRNIRKVNSDMVASFDVGTSPFVTLSSVALLKSNGNSRVEPGDLGKLSVNFSNIELGNSDSTQFSFSINDPDILNLKTEFSVSVPGLQNLNIILDSAFYVKPQFKSKMVWLHYSLSSERNNIEDSVYLTIGYPKILLVSKAERPDLADYYVSSITNNDKLPEILYNEPAQFYSKRDAIIIFSGKAEDSIFTQTEIDSITTYLNNGGNIFLSGQNLAEYLGSKYPIFASNVLGINWVRKGSVLKRRVFGINQDMFGNPIRILKFAGNEGANNEQFCDVLSSPDNSFHFSFTYDTTIFAGGGGWKKNSNNGKVFYLPFGFESINNIESSVTRNQLMTSVLDWFYDLTDLNNDISNPLTYKLEQNYPNPFNPTTNIRYTLAANGNVQINVYNTLGQKIRTLSNGFKSAGSYQVTWNGDNDAGSKVAGGVYFFQLKATGSGSSDFIQIKKMLLIK